MKDKIGGLFLMLLLIVGVVGFVVTLPISGTEPRPPSTPHPLNSSEVINISEYYSVSPGDNIICGKTASGILLSVSFREEDGGDFVVYKITEFGKEFIVYAPGRLVQDHDEKGELIYNLRKETKHTLIYKNGVASPWTTKPFPREGTIADHFNWRYSYHMEWGPCE